MKISGIITMIVSLMISIVSGYCTVVGMGKVFVSAAAVTMFIASVIEIGRVVLIYDLHHYWQEMKVLQKIPGIMMLLISITLSAMGIFGFMSNAHSQRTQEVVPIEMKITEKQQQIDILKDAIKVNDEQLKQYDGKAFNKYTEMGYVTKAVNLQKEQQKITNELYNDNRSKQEEITVLNQEILKLKLEAEQKAPTLAHLKYYAKLFHVDNDTAIIIFIVMIMLVFDTLAMYLMITADWINKLGQEQNYRIKKEEILDKILEIDTEKSLKNIEEISNKLKEINIIPNDIFEKINKNIDEKMAEIKMGLQDKSLEEKLDKIENKIQQIQTDNSEQLKDTAHQIINNVKNEKTKKTILTEKNIEEKVEKMVSLINDNESILDTPAIKQYISDYPKLIEKLRAYYNDKPSIITKLDNIVRKNENI